MTKTSDQWKDKIALISGGSSGIGLAAAKWLAAHGSHVWLAARRKPLLDEALTSLPCSEQQRHGYFSADISEPEQAAKAVEFVSQEIGLPDLLINSAGVAHPGYIQELDLDIFDWQMKVNYFGTVYLTKAVLPGMMSRGSGHIVNISSVAGFLGIFGYSAYGASKYAVRGFSDALRAEMKPHGIRVTIVYPPDTDTPQYIYEKERRPAELLEISSSPPLTAEDVAGEIMRGVSKGRSVVLPGFQTKLFYYLSGILSPAVYPLMDWLVARARDKNNGRSQNHKSK
jgi:3-dehydrosphinganine reductase